MREITILVSILLLALLLNSVFPKTSVTTLDRPTLEKFIIEDAKTSYGESAGYKIVKFENRENQHYAELDVTVPLTLRDGCFITMRRYYTLFPIAYREEFYRQFCN
ncbi:hypothetical protein HY989_06095 [Candidatus Micrarchaeota archaeon]|nr:hypothetical protein [Candidatus Micrarchaeota archaeon]